MIVFLANRSLGQFYTRMPAAGPQHVTAVFEQYTDMHSAAQRWQNHSDLAHSWNPRLKPLRLIYQ